MKTVKLSYSILNAWSSAKFEDAIAMYLGKQIPSTPYMELGKIKHTQWENYTNRTGELHPELKGGKIVNPIVEQKYSKLLPLSDDYQILIRGIIDLETEDTLIDYKCGRSTPSSYVDGWQLDLYKLLRPHATLGKYLCFNPYTNQVSVGVKYLNQSNAETALEHIMTFGGEMISYLTTNRLLVDYKEERKEQPTVQQNNKKRGG